MAVNAAVPMLVIGLALVYAGVPSAERMTVGAEPLSGDVARGLASHIEGEEPDRFARLALAIRIEGEEPSPAGRPARGMLDRAGPALPVDVRERLSRIASEPAPQTRQCSLT
jgi:hypothetical protein